MRCAKPRSARNSAAVMPVVFVAVFGLLTAEVGCKQEGRDAPAAGLNELADQSAGDRRIDAPPQVAQEADLARAEANRDAAIRYPDDMMKVQEAWANDDPARVRKLLNEQQPNRRIGVEDHRGFEWYYWDRKLNWSDVSLSGHTDTVRCAAFSPDGDRIASASVDGTARIWNMATGRQELSLKGHTGSVSGVAFSPSDKRVATASSDGTVKVWDAATGNELHTLKGHTGPVWCVAFTPDGKRLASGSFDRSIKIWDVAAASEVRTLSGHTDQ